MEENEEFSEGRLLRVEDISAKKEVNLIINRIVYKIDPNNMPDIEDLKQLIEKEKVIY